MSKKKDLVVCVSLDVEEEGLFSGRYPSRDCTVKNVSRLRALEPLSHEFGLPPTLFCAHSVFTDRAARASLEYMRDRCGAEIGAHLHHWSTPPFSPEGALAAGEPTRTHLLEPDLLEKRLETLLAAGRDFHGAPLRSFRMGRWDLKSPLRGLLARHGILVDSSICPLRIFKNGADHFLAPADPWRTEDGLIEAPITQIPVLPGLPRLWRRLAARNTALLDRYHFFGALSANPFWHAPALMRLCARLHSARGGSVLSLFWHSSEMMPGASPRMPDEAAAKKFLKNIFAFCAWLRENFNVLGLTYSQLHAAAPALNFPTLGRGSEMGDW